jgi:SAM-dependent methyltransferase
MRVPPALNLYQYEDLQARPHDCYAEMKYRILQTHLAGRKNLSILNVGCGSGEFSFHLGSVGHRVLGIDPSPEYIALARVNARRASLPNCTFRVSSIENFKSHQTFDVVAALDVLEHIEDDRRAFAKMANLARSGGILLVTVPAGRWLFGAHDEALGHFRRYSRAHLHRLAAPFCRIDTLRFFGFSLIPVCLWYSKLRRKPYPVAESGDRSRSPLLARALRTLLRLDRRLPMPFGTSLLLKGEVRMPLTEEVRRAA